MSWTMDGKFDGRRQDLIALTIAFAQAGMGAAAVSFALEALNDIDEVLAAREEDTCSK